MKAKNILQTLAIVCNVLSTVAQINFDWAKRIGSTSIDHGHAIASDAAGNVYTTGYFEGTVDFDPGPGVFNINSLGSYNVFISKIDASGNFVWARSMGGDYFGEGISIVADNAGNVFTTGTFWSAMDFDPGPGVFSLTSNGNHDIFVSKLDPSGNFMWAKQIGGTTFDQSRSIKVDGSGNIFLTGAFTGSVDFDPGPGVFNINAFSGSGYLDIFISKLDGSGNFVWAKQLGGIFGDAGCAIDIDISGNIYSTGWFQGTCDFDPGPSTFTLSTNNRSSFVCKLDASGNFVWAKQLYASNACSGAAIDVDALGNIYSTGMFQGTIDMDPGITTFNLISFGGRDIFVSKLDASGNFIWGNKIGGASDEEGWSIAVDASGSVFTTGYFRDTCDFDPGPGTFTLATGNGYFNSFISQLDVSGNFVWTGQLGFNTIVYGTCIIVDGLNNVISTGYFSSPGDFDPTAGVFNLSGNSAMDVFILKMGRGQISGGVTPKILTENQQCSVFPIPNSGCFNIQIDNAIKNGQLILLNSIGQKVHEQKIIQGTNEIKTNGLSFGLYNYILLLDNQTISNGKLTIE